MKDKMNLIDKCVIVFAIILLIIVVNSLMSSSSCTEISCGSGYYDNGVCVCPTGYTGVNCEISN